VSHDYSGERYIQPVGRLPEKDTRLRIALIYPDTYFTGMSNLSVQAVYGLLSERTPYAPDLYFYQSDFGLYRHRDMVRKHPQVRLRDYDIVAFSIPYEIQYINVHRILAAHGIGLTPEERAGTPVVIAGGIPVTANPLPLGGLIDLAFIGEAEGAFPPFLDDVLHTLPKLKSPRGADARNGLLARWHGRPGFWCPQISGDLPRHTLADLGAHDTVSRIITPRTVFSNRMLLQTARGCAARCKFCLAGHTTAPLRLLSREAIAGRAALARNVTNRIGIIASAPADHPDIADITTKLVDDGFSISFSSLRLSSLTDEMVQCLLRSGQRTVTIAPEVLDESYRKVIGKPFPANAEVLARTRAFLQAGVPRIKYYFMLGFSFEDDGYIARLARWLEQLDAVAQELRPKGEPPLTFAFSFFVPKPQTPFALEPMPARAELQHRRKLLKASFRGRSRLKFESPAWSLLQERLSRGARDAAGTIAFLSTGRLTTSSVNAALERFSIEESAAHPEQVWPTLH